MAKSKSKKKQIKRKIKVNQNKKELKRKTKKKSNNITKNTPKIKTKSKKVVKKTKQVKKVKQDKHVKEVKQIKKKENIKSKQYNLKNIILILLLAILLFILVLVVYYKIYISPIPKIESVTISENNLLSISYSTDLIRPRNKMYCYYSKEDKIPDINDKNWFETELNQCNFYIDDNVYYAYLKNEDNIIIKIDSVNSVGRVYNLKLNKDKIYLPINGNEKITLKYDKVGYVSDSITYESSDPTVAEIDSNGNIKGINKGSTTIKATILDKSATLDLVVTDLITNRPSDFDYDKDYLPCNKYTKEENDLIDEILKYKINNVGYQTRAAVVEAARFLVFDFPYRINYFYENGRQTTNNVDGEGRYYHTGFYLHESRFDNITGTQYGPEIWGCSLYDRPAHRYIDNGLDCSGFVSWALLNGGFDVEDVGAGWSDNLDLTDYGDVFRITSTLANSDEIKVGDLLHSTRAGGHIGIIVGIDEDYYYVAQALWYNDIGVIVTAHSKNNLSKDFPHVVLMDDYYENDGNLTNMW